MRNMPDRSRSHTGYTQQPALAKPFVNVVHRKSALSWLKSALFWRMLGIYFLLSLPALILAVLILDNGSQRTVAVVCWLSGLAIMMASTAITTGPIRDLLHVLMLPWESSEYRELLSRLQGRSDDVGDAAGFLAKRDSEHQRQLRDVKLLMSQSQSSATQLSAVMQAMVEGVIAVDKDERILFANRVACRLLEVETSAIQNRLIFECVRNKHLQETLQEALATGETATVEFHLTRKDAQISLVASPIAGGGAVLVLADVTDVRRLESMRRDFVSGVSHELKTPLTVIQACTETLLDGAIDEPDIAKRFLGQIEEQSERLLQLILGMLQLARVESGEQMLDIEPVDLFEVVEQVVSQMRPVAESKHIALDSNGESELFVMGDYQAIRTIVGNLVDNALKYTPEHGSVSVLLLTSDTAAVLRVIDTGVGISRKDQERIFERFYRVERDRNRERGGTGLGLAIVKHLCQALGAEVQLQSTPGKGSTIDITFPFRD
ncbi:MAG: ATP-binding protein [Planctomycetaceae bacterium]